MAFGVFKLTGVPIFREGFAFYLPNLSLEVASVCSGIRSSIALFITSILAGHLFLDKTWSKVLLVISIYPITIFKNGLRIVVLGLLSSYVDRRFLSGWLHTSGGIPFFVLALGFLGSVLWGLRKIEKKVSRRERVDYADAKRSLKRAV